MVQVNPEDALMLTLSKNCPRVENTGSFFKVLAHSQIPNAWLHWQLPEDILSVSAYDLIYLRGYIYMILSEPLHYTLYSLDKLKEGGAQYSVAAVYNGWVQDVTLQRGNSL